MNQRVEDLAQKMVQARQVREQAQANQANRNEMKRQQSQNSSAINFFSRKTQSKENEAAQKEKRIKEMEAIEAELLDKIKKTQVTQLQEFNKLEEVMYEQQLGVRKRVAQNSPSAAVTLNSQTSIGSIEVKSRQSPSYMQHKSPYTSYGQANQM